MFETQLKVLNYQRRTGISKKTGAPYDMRFALVRVQGEIVQFSVDNELDLTSFIDKDVTARIKLSSGMNNEPRLVIVSVE